MSYRIAILMVVEEYDESCERCLRSVAQLTDPKPLVVLIDVTGRERLEPFARQILPGVTVLSPVRRKSFSESANLGLRYLFEHEKGGGEEPLLIVFVNKELLLSPTFASDLVRAFTALPDMGVASPIMLRACREPLLDHQVDEYIKTEAIEACGSRWYRGLFPVFATSVEEEIFAPTPLCAVFKASILERARIADHTWYDPNLIWHETEDMTLRLGVRCVFLPEVVVYRQCFATNSAATGLGMRQYHHKTIRSWWRFAARHVSLKTWIKRSHWVIAMLLKTVFACLRSPRSFFSSSYVSRS